MVCFCLWEFMFFCKNCCRSILCLTKNSIIFVLVRWGVVRDPIFSLPADLSGNNQGLRAAGRLRFSGSVSPGNKEAAPALTKSPISSDNFGDFVRRFRRFCHSLCCYRLFSRLLCGRRALDARCVLPVCRVVGAAS